jgi:hypothetical protein
MARVFSLWMIVGVLCLPVKIDAQNQLIELGTFVEEPPSMAQGGREIVTLRYPACQKSSIPNHSFWTASRMLCCRRSSHLDSGDNRIWVICCSLALWTPRELACQRTSTAF